jgi:cytochrome c
MSSFRKALTATAALLCSAAALAQAASFPGIGRPATPKEVAAWDIDVRPDFKGLPKGSGSVAKGMDVWESKCASCHGVFGESNEVFAPLVGGTTKDDIRTGRVARLLDPSFPGRTTLMKVSTVSTLWDYINRAMPWNAPKSLSTEEVYAVTANRNGKTTDHGMWPGKSMGNGGKPDVRAVACMKDCAAEPTVASFLPDFARNAHGNLAEQNRMVGAQHGADTTKPAGAAPAAPAAPKAPATPAAGGDAASFAPIQKLLTANNCLACHGIDKKIVGPGMTEIAKKYAGRGDAQAYLAQKIRVGGAGVWGGIPMPPQAISEGDAATLAKWLAEGAKR